MTEKSPYKSLEEFKEKDPAAYIRFQRANMLVEFCREWGLYHPRLQAERNFNSLMKLKDRPSDSAKDPEEKRLGIALGNIRKWRPELYNKLVKVKPDWFEDRGLNNFNTLMKLKDRPSNRAKDSKEKGLGESISTIKKSRPELYAKLVKAKPDWFKDKLLVKFNALIKLKDRPSSKSKDPEESKLGQSIGRLRTFRPDLYAKLVKTKTHWFEDSNLANFNALMKMKDRPNQNSKDPEEKELGQSAIGNIKIRRPDLYAKLVKAKPHWFEDKLLINFNILMKLKDRPNQESKDLEEKSLGHFIGSLRRRKPEFYAKLVKAKPHWFKR